MFWIYTTRAGTYFMVLEYMRLFGFLFPGGNILLKNSKKDVTSMIAYHLDEAEIKMVEEVLKQRGYKVETNIWGQSVDNNLSVAMTILGWVPEAIAGFTSMENLLLL